MSRSSEVFKIDGFLKRTNVLGTPTCKDGLCTMEVGEMVTEMGTLAKSLLGVERTAYSALTTPVSYIQRHGQSRGLYANVSLDNHEVGNHLPLNFDSHQATFGGETSLIIGSHPTHIGAELSMQKGKGKIQGEPIDINFTSTRLEAYASSEIGAGIIAGTNIGLESLRVKAQASGMAMEESHRALKWGVELSRPFKFTNDVTLTPQAQVQYTTISASGRHDTQASYDQNRIASLIARVGTRLDVPFRIHGKPMNGWVDLSAFKELKGQIQVSGSDFSTKGEVHSVALRNHGLWFDLKAGATMNLTKALEANVDLGSRLGWKRRGFVMNLGVKYHF